MPHGFVEIGSLTESVAEDNAVVKMIQSRLDQGDAVILLIENIGIDGIVSRQPHQRDDEEDLIIGPIRNPEIEAG